jgi:hypothetical protein
MLHYGTVSPQLLELLTGIMSLPQFSSYSLAGGTSLALQLGHRISVDIDVFGTDPLEDLEVLPLLEQWGPVVVIKRSENILVCSVGGIKLDAIRYRYPVLEPLNETDGLRLYSLGDIAAMKLNAIASRGSRKDFIDLDVLLNHLSPGEIWSLFRQKFPDASEFLVRKSLTFFYDAEQEAFPQLLVPLDWEHAKQRITQFAIST